MVNTLVLVCMKIYEDTYHFKSVKIVNDPVMQKHGHLHRIYTNGAKRSVSYFETKIQKSGNAMR